MIILLDENFLLKGIRNLFFKNLVHCGFSMMFCGNEFVLKVFKRQRKLANYQMIVKSIYEEKKFLGDPTGFKCKHLKI